MSMVPTRGPDSYYTGYGYGYGYGYREVPETPKRGDKRARSTRNNPSDSKSDPALEDLGFGPRRASREMTREN